MKFYEISKKNHFGFPLTNKDPSCFKDSEKTKPVVDYVLKNLVDMGLLVLMLSKLKLILMDYIMKM